jgi:hypothetical protein
MLFKSLLIKKNGNLNVSKKTFKNAHVTNTREILSVEDTKVSSKMCL